ncbi:MAG: efflux RND transporter periplasmic adaptor subunit [Syntrophaceae bacterium]|nr:efflux RND transporter periplasmic adaptor subunit [Syntrophaceae bacterium]
MNGMKTGRPGWRLSRFRSGLPGAFLLVVLALVAVLTAGCQKKETKTDEKIINVRAATVEKKSLRPSVEAVGTLKPFQEVVISPEVDGIIRKLYVEEGSSVAKGMVLAEINETDYRLDLERAEAALKQAEATLANVKVEYSRKDALYKEQLVTQQQFDDITTRVTLATGDVDRARAALSMARERYSRSRVRSPMAGAVREKRVTAGDFVRTGTPMLWIVRSNPIKLSFSVPEKDVSSLKLGQEVDFRVDSFPGRTFTGRLMSIYPSLDEKTRTLQAEAHIPNPQGLLKPGFFARVTLYTGPAKDTVVIPITSILYENALKKVFLVEGDRAREVKIQIGGKYGESMAVLEGLQGGEQIVVVGQNTLADGVKVNVAR